jgi:hypothetical protein
MKTKEKTKRQFLGKVGNKLSDFIDKQERAFEKKHLKAYLRGEEKFVIGYDTSMGGKQTIYANVKQRFI